MHSMFRIGQVIQIDKNDRLWQVDLTLTSDNDLQLHALTKCMQEGTEDSTGWLRPVFYPAGGQRPFGPLGD
jgi:hypothetical protein